MDMKIVLIPFACEVVPVLFSMWLAVLFYGKLFCKPKSQSPQWKPRLSCSLLVCCIELMPVIDMVKEDGRALLGFLEVRNPIYIL